MKKRIIIALALCVALFFGYIAADNRRIAVREYTYSGEKVPKAFDGYKICVITDFHNSSNYESICKKAKSANPDVICLIGDMVDMETDDFTNLKCLIDGLSEVCDVYYTFGNHEMWSTSITKTDEPAVKEAVADCDVKLLNDGVKTIEKDGEVINLIGYGDEIYNDFDGNYEKHARNTMTALYNTLDKTLLNIALVHRAQYFDVFADIGYDMVLSGHLHGGHINIPKIREYILNSHCNSAEFRKGEYRKDDSVMYVSGGLANEDIPRVFNTPEIVILELKSK